jgi:UDP-N-acetylmuramoyl-tripeptide--D-alanyl-D-alanine ligase
MPNYVYLIIIWAALIAFQWFTYKRNAHIFQLNGYKPKVHRDYAAKNRIFYLQRAGKAKKPLVWTARVKRLTAAYAVASIILPFLLPPVLIRVANFLISPVEKAVNSRYINEARRIINDAKASGLKVIGVTGSYGKTSVKVYIGKLLGSQANVLVTPESYNTTLGIVRTIREHLRATHEYFVVEMGARNKGDIAEICELVKPDYAVITAIGEAHLESFGSIENTTDAKFELFDSLDPENAVAFLNADNEYIRKRIETIKQPAPKIVCYGIDNVSADYRAEDIATSENGSVFNVRGTSFRTKLIGAHNVLNLTAAIAVANTLKIPVDALAVPVRKLEPVPHRLQMHGGGDRLILDDAYNSNPAGAKSALDVLAEFRDRYKILVTPGMVELGEHEFSLNVMFGAQAAEVCDYVILVGIERTRPIATGLHAAGMPSDRYTSVQTLEDALQIANSLDTAGKSRIILLENDLPDNYT